MAKAKGTPEIAQEIEKSGFKKVGNEERVRRVTLSMEQKSVRALGVCDRRAQVSAIEQEIKTLVETFNHELERLNNERRELQDALDAENDVIVRGEEVVEINCDVWEKNSVQYIVEEGQDVRVSGNVLAERQVESIVEGGFYQRVVPDGVNPV